MNKILVLNTQDIYGGAARATYNTFNEIDKLNEIDIKYGVSNKTVEHKNIFEIKGKSTNFQRKIKSVLNKIPTLFYQNRDKSFFSNNILGLDVIKEVSNFDIVHLNWINSGFISIDDLKKFKKPIIWTLHDMWPLTGGCHFTFECDHFKDSCGNCIVLHSSKDDDLSFNNLNRKKKAYKKIDLYLVTTNNWLKSVIENTELYKKSINKEITVIPIGVYTEIFKPLENILKIKKQYQLPLDKKLVMFIAQSLNDQRKGTDLFLDSLEYVSNKDDILIILVGKSDENICNILNNKKIPFKEFGYISNDDELNKIYNLSDVLVVPSRQETLPNVILESMSCGTPVVSFDVCGHPDAISHKENGYLAKPFDVEDLANGIEHIIFSETLLTFSDNCRKRILQEFDIRIIAEKYIQFYKNILSE